MVLYYQSIFEVSFQERFKHTGVLSNCDFTQCQTILKVINKAKNNTDQNQQLWETHTRCFCHSTCSVGGDVVTVKAIRVQ